MRGPGIILAEKYLKALSDKKLNLYIIMENNEEIKGITDEREKAIILNVIEDLLLRTGKPLEPIYLFDAVKHECGVTLHGTDALDFIKADKRFRHSYEGGIYLSSESESKARKERRDVITSVKCLIDFFTYPDKYQEDDIAILGETYSRTMKSVKSEIKKAYKEKVNEIL